MVDFIIGIIILILCGKTKSPPQQGNDCIWFINTGEHRGENHSLDHNESDIDHNFHDF